MELLIIKPFFGPLLLFTNIKNSSGWQYALSPVGIRLGFIPGLYGGITISLAASTS